VVGTPSRKRARRRSRDELQLEHAKANPVQDELNPAEGGGWKLKSLRVRATEALEKYGKRQRLRTTKHIGTALKWAWGAMGPHADVPPKHQRKAYFTKLRDKLVDGDLARRTRDLYSKNLRLILSQLPDLDPDFLEELANLPRLGTLSKGSGDAFQRSDFEVMFARIAAEDATVQGMVWVGLSGGPQIVDTVFLPFSAVNWHTGRIRYKRIKTQEDIEFYALPPLLDWLKARRALLGQNAVFIFPELIFSGKDLSSPECNTPAWDGFKAWKNMEVPQLFVVRAANYGFQRITDFFKRCGIKAAGISHKSFRKHNISFWTSIGIKLSTRMLMAGHSKLEAHLRYDVPADFELIRSRDILWDYYQSIMAGKSFFIPTTPYDLYAAMKDENAQLREQLNLQGAQLQAVMQKLDVLVQLHVAGGKLETEGVEGLLPAGV
jgi:hypothetical protein